MMYKIENSLATDYLKSAAPIATKYLHNSRSVANSDLYTSGANIKYYTRSFQYEHAHLWNTLSTDIQKSNNT